MATGDPWLKANTLPRCLCGSSVPPLGDPGTQDVRGSVVDTPFSFSFPCPLQVYDSLQEFKGKKLLPATSRAQALSHEVRWLLVPRAAELGGAAFHCRSFLKKPAALMAKAGG